jgi:hypothetical protein
MCSHDITPDYTSRYTEIRRHTLPYTCLQLNTCAYIEPIPASTSRYMCSHDITPDYTSRYIDIHHRTCVYNLLHVHTLKLYLVHRDTSIRPGGPKIHRVT